MSYDISALKVLIKKIFPPKESVYIVDSNGDGTIDSIVIKALNVFMPIEIPEKIEIGGFNSENFNVKNFDLSEYGKLYLDDNPIDISKVEFEVEKLKERFFIYHKGEEFRIDDLIKGKLAGRLIALGDTIEILIKVDKETITKFSEGKHKLALESELVPKLEFHFELNHKNMNKKLDEVISYFK
ncbi:MAG: hypothetical protein ACFFEO_06330 [Candidatus Thorarchaeota archaeon]